MKHINSRALKKSEYREFIERRLKESAYIILSVLDNDRIYSFGESVSLPKSIDYHTILISEYEQLYCYEIKYYETLSALTQYESLTEFFDMTNAYRLMFVANNAVTVECMREEVIVYG